MCVCGAVDARVRTFAWAHVALPSLQRAAILSSAASLAPLDFSTLSHNVTTTGKKLQSTKCVV
jgi:hypothetical protein